MNQVCEWVIEKEPKFDKDGKMITPSVGHFEVKEKTIIVEKEVYEAVLRNSVRVNDLEAENQRLKEEIINWREKYFALLDNDI